MMRAEKIWPLVFCVGMFGCGGTSSPKTATGTWRAVLTSTSSQAGQPGEQAVLLVFLQQNGTTLTATINAVLQQSNCFPSGSVTGITLSGQLTLPGEAISNLHLAGAVGGVGGTTTLSMTGSLPSDANSGAGLFALLPNPSTGCSIGTGTFQMTRMLML